MHHHIAHVAFFKLNGGLQHKDNSIPFHALFRASRELKKANSRDAPIQLFVILSAIIDIVFSSVEPLHLYSAPRPWLHRFDGFEHRTSCI